MFSSLSSDGFGPARREPRFLRWRTAILAQLITSIALVVSIVLLITVATIQFAEAHGGADLPGSDAGSGFGAAVLVSLVLLAMGALTAVVTSFDRRQQPRV